MKKPLHSITKKDLKFDWFSGTGAGGQHRNKHQNCLRLTHLETGITVTAQSHKSRQANIRDALEQIVERLEPWLRAKANDDNINAAKSDELIRTYHYVDNRVTDHSSGRKWSVDNFELDYAICARLAVGKGVKKSGR